MTVRARVRGLPGGRLAWRVLVTLAGFGVIAVGIVLLPLPGPGWLIIFAGLGLLASEYAWAARLLDRARRYLSAWTRWTLRQRRLVRVLVGLAGLAVLVGVAALCWWLLR